MKDYKISIVVPVYNIEGYVKKCVDSLVDQTYRNLEIILVDDGSQDRSGYICDGYGGRYESVRVLHKENGGLISAWMAGVKLATGDYLSFVDGDDWVEKNMIEEMAEELSGIGDEVVCSDYIIERTLRKGGEKVRDTEYVYQTMPPGEYDRLKIERQIIPQLLGNEHRAIATSRCMKLFSTELIRKNLKYCDRRIRMGEDSMIVLPSLIDARRIFVMDHKAYYHYEYIGNSMVHKYDRGAYDNIMRLYEGLSGMLVDKFAVDPERLEAMKKRLDMELIFLLFFVLKNEIRNPSSEYPEKIRGICKDERIAKIVKNTEVEVSDRSNRLLYAVLKNPSFLNISMLRGAMKVYDARY